MRRLWAGFNYMKLGLTYLLIARVERFELPSKVLETSILPLNYTRVFPLDHHLWDWDCKCTELPRQNKSAPEKKSEADCIVLAETSRGFQ